MAISEYQYLQGKQQLSSLPPSKSAVPAALSRRLGEEYATTQAEKLAQMQRGQGQIEEARARNEADRYYLGGVKKMLPYTIGLKALETGVDVYDVIKDYAAERQQEIDTRITRDVQKSMLDALEGFINTLGQRDLIESQRPLIDTGYYETPFGIPGTSQSYDMQSIPNMPMDRLTSLTPVPQITLQPNRTGPPLQTFPLQTYSNRGGY